jgi:hypothetical protein
MAAFTKTLTGGTGTAYYVTEDLGSTAAAVLTAAGTRYGVEVDARNNPGEDVYVILYNTALGGVTVGTTDAYECFWGPAGKKTPYLSLKGHAYGTAITAACVKEAAGTGNTAPSGVVKVTVYV